MKGEKWVDLVAVVRRRVSVQFVARHFVRDVDGNPALARERDVGKPVEIPEDDLPEEEERVFEAADVGKLFRRLVDDPDGEYAMIALSELEGGLELDDGEDLGEGN